MSLSFAIVWTKAHIKIKQNNVISRWYNDENKDMKKENTPNTKVKSQSINQLQEDINR